MSAILIQKNKKNSKFFSFSNQFFSYDFWILYQLVAQNFRFNLTYRVGQTYFTFFSTKFAWSSLLFEFLPWGTKRILLKRKGEFILPHPVHHIDKFINFKSHTKKNRKKFPVFHFFPFFFYQQNYTKMWSKFSLYSPKSLNFNPLEYRFPWKSRLFTFV